MSATAQAGSAPYRSADPLASKPQCAFFLHSRFDEPEKLRVIRRRQNHSEFFAKNQRFSSNGFPNGGRPNVKSTLQAETDAISGPGKLNLSTRKSNTQTRWD
jgi:hypothetical protein